MKTTLVFFSFLILLSFHSQGQSIRWEEDAKRTYIFEISNDEAEKFVRCKTKDSLAILEMLHTPRGSFVKKWKDAPQQGHFIFVKIEKGRVYYEYVSIIPFQVFMFGEYGALTLQVIDEQDSIRSDAKVYVRGKRRRQDIYVPFNSKSRTYTVYDETEYSKRLLVVELDTFRAIFDLTKHGVSPRYGGYNSYNSQPSFYSYLITDKNKYKPGESVRFKSYSLYGNQTPINHELEIWLQVGRYGRSKKTNTIIPYHPGGYAGELLLHDSLELRLDNSYTIQLRDKRGKIVASTSFQYEDYELFDSRLETKLNKRHYAPNSNSLEIKALDANNLLLQDVQAEVIVTRGQVEDVFSDFLQLPDTLLYKKIDLDNGKPTLVDIPADLFGESNCTYKVEVNALTHDNQALRSLENAVFYKSIYNVFTYTRNDTICFQFHELGQNKNKEATYWINDDSNTRKTVNLPLKIPFNQFVKEYHFEIDSLNFSQTVSVATIYAGLDIEGGIHRDSFNVKLVNPLNLELSWYLYQRNRLLEKGFGKEFDFKYSKTDLSKVHYVEFFYLMGGTEQYYNQAFVPKIDFLDVSIDLPDRIYPGQSLDATISVKDYWGHPVQDVDLTAFAYNTQLNYDVPDLPYYGATPFTREKRANYSMKDERHVLNVPLNYSYWNKKLQLDTIKYYQFVYPWDTIFQYTINTPDSTTQIAPYLMKNGKVVDVYVLEINNRPVYFSWTGQPKRYSFIIGDTGIYEISLRLHDRVIRLDSLRFQKGKKTILSLDMDNLPDNGNVFSVMLNRTKDGNNNYLFRDKDSNYIFSNTEKRIYQSLICQVPANPNYDFTYLKFEDCIYPIYSPCFHSSLFSVKVGPLPQGYMTYCDDIRYKHENGFSYKFEDNVVYKYPLEACPKTLHFSSSYQLDNLNDFALTQKSLLDIIANCQKKNPWYPQNLHISQHDMNLNFKIPMHPDSIGVTSLLLHDVKTQNILYFNRLRELLWQYPTILSTITPAIYDVILLYDNGDFRCFDSIPIKPYTYTEVNLSNLAVQIKDSLSDKHLNIYNQLITNKIEQRSINKWNSVRGIVKNDNGFPLQSVIVNIKGENGVARSDEQGYFEIAIKDKQATLSFSLFGYTTKYLDVTMGSEVIVTMQKQEYTMQGTSRFAGNKQGATLKGKVTEADGKTPIEFANVVLLQDGQMITGASTKEDGCYTLVGISSGTYDLRVTFIGYQPYLLTGLILQGNITKIQDILLHVSDNVVSYAVVEITAERPIFEQGDATASTRVSSDDLTNMPGKSMSDILSTMSGVTSSTSRTTYQISNSENDGYFVDGMSSDLSNLGPQELREKLEEIAAAKQAAEDRLYSELMQLNTLRSNFSDVGFWEPCLFTDQNGKAKLSVTFPDNITQWNTVIYAMNRQLKTATLRKSIQSYKPLMAELKNPQFLVIGDTSFFAGNIRNYTRDNEIAGKVFFVVGQDTTLKQDIHFSTSHQDKILVSPLSTDSISTSYLFLRNDGYLDGEKRDIPVIERGTEIADGKLQFLKSGEQKTVSAGANEEIHITLTANPMDVYVNTTSFLRNYRYDCNEQLASKLIGLLNYKLYQEYVGKKFREDKRIQNIINKLLKNRNGDQLWSWWGSSPNTNYWMSAHVLRALIQADKAGYKVNVDFSNIEQDYINTRRYRASSLHDIEILNALSEAGTKQNYAAAIELFDKEIARKEYIADSVARVMKTKVYTSYLKEKLLLMEIRQRQNIAYSPDSLQKYLKKDVLGAVYCDDGIERKWHDNSLITTLIAYRIISRDSTLQHLKESMQLYILRTKERSWNTYQASSAVMTVLPDLLKNAATKKTPSIAYLSGKEQKEVTEFPYETTLSAGEQLHIDMKSGIPLIYSDYQIKRTTSEFIGDAFAIQTQIKGDSLIGGKATTIQVKLTVKQANAEHVMIDIPIPAGCSYASKKTNYVNFGRYYPNPGRETYREYFKEKVIICCEKLPMGEYEYEIEILPRYSGSYWMNPAKVEMMYFPVIYSNNNEKRVKIK